MLKQAGMHGMHLVKVSYFEIAGGVYAACKSALRGPQLVYKWRVPWGK